MRSLRTSARPCARRPACGPRAARAREYWEALHPTSAGGGYVNFLMNEGADRVRASYRGNYARLAAIKERYDPDNVFHVNQNIPPDSRGDLLAG